KDCVKRTRSFRRCPSPEVPPFNFDESRANFPDPTCGDMPSNRPWRRPGHRLWGGRRFTLIPGSLRRRYFQEPPTVHSKHYQLSHMLSEVRSTPIPTWKRILDIGCCLAALPLLALMTLIAALITRAASPGPIFFRQE